MRVKVLLQITTDDGTPGELEEIASLTKSVDRPEDLGLSLAESKALLTGAQHRIVAAQKGLDREAALLRNMRPVPPQQGQLPACVPHPLRRRASGEPSPSPLFLP